MNLTLSIGMLRNPRTAPIFDGRVKADGLDLVPSNIYASELFWRQLKFGEFDVSEMSISTLMMAIAAGDTRWVGIPICTTRKFFHTEILVRKDAGIDSPADLRGKRVGVPEYQQTAALWTRGVLEHEFGVKPADCRWWMERGAERSHRSAVDFVPPAGLEINQVPADRDLGTKMRDGEIDAVVHYLTEKNLVDRARIDLWNHADVRPLFADPLAEGVRYFRKTGIFPINHAMVIRRELHERHPWIAINLLKAFNQANLLADEERWQHMLYHHWSGAVPAESAEAIRAPLVRHGVKANRHTFETAAQYSHEQQLTPRRVAVDELFAASTLDL
jgi:4,5-dihydroxyphthalate decarboxylase